MKILLVEDDEGGCWSVKNTLTSQHYLIPLLVDGQAGLSHLQEAFCLWPGLLDVCIYTKSWMWSRVCRQLRSHRIFNSAVDPALDNTFNKVVRCWADDYLVKPFWDIGYYGRFRLCCVEKSGSLFPVESQSSSPLVVRWPAMDNFTFNC